MNIFLLQSEQTSTNRYAKREFERVLELFRRSRDSRHNLVDRIDDADLVFAIGVAEPTMASLRHFVRSRKIENRIIVYSAGDQIVPYLAGIYPSIDRRWYDSRWCRSGCYLRVSTNDRGSSLEKNLPRKFLFSFRGNASTHSIREKLLRLECSNASLIDTGDKSYTDENRLPYVSEIAQSSFVLCPRGAGSSTFRLFETMAMGRVPVIISDAWVPPCGPNWDACSVRVPEKQIQTIPKVLAELEQNAIQMGERARQEWERFFSPHVYFNYLVDQCIELLKEKRTSLFERQLRLLKQSLHPEYIRTFTFSRMKKAIRHRDS